jgi:hypothetical protein
MVYNTALPPIILPPTQIPEGQRPPVNKPEDRNREIKDEAQRPQRVDYIPAIPDDEELERLSQSYRNDRPSGPTSAYGEVADLSDVENRGRLLDIFA